MIFSMSRFHQRVLRTGLWNPYPSHTWVNLDHGATGVEGVIRIWSVHPQVHPPFVEYYERFGMSPREPNFRVSMIDDPSLTDIQTPAVAERHAPSVIQWVSLNQEKLLIFSRKAVRWNCDYEQRFVRGLQLLRIDSDDVSSS
jgi:hypothetical protein